MEQQLSVKNLAVLLVDMQDYFLNTQEKMALIPRQISIINICEEKNIPLAVIKYAGDGEVNDLLKKEILKLPSNNVRTFKKYMDDAFSVKELDTWLKKLGIEVLLIMGVQACACVYQTANSAIKNGYKIIISSDLIAGYCSRPNCSGRHSWYVENGMYTENHEDIVLI